MGGACGNVLKKGDNKNGQPQRVILKNRHILINKKSGSTSQTDQAMDGILSHNQDQNSNQDGLDYDAHVGICFMK